MSRGRHARDGQRRDALRARARDTWTRLRRLAGRIAALNAALPGALIPGRATMIPAPDMRPAQAPRPADPPAGGAVRAGATPLVVAGEQPGELPHLPGCDGSCGGMAAHEAHLDDGGCPCCYCAQYAVDKTPGAVAAGTGTSAGDSPPPAAAATTPRGAAPLPLPGPQAPPGQGQPHHLWPGGPVTAPAGSRRSNEQQSARAPQHPMPAWKGDYRPTQPFRAVSDLPPASIVRPHYERHEARRDSTARWGA